MVRGGQLVTKLLCYTDERTGREGRRREERKGGEEEERRERRRGEREERKGEKGGEREVGTHLAERKGVHKVEGCVHLCKIDYQPSAHVDYSHLRAEGKTVHGQLNFHSDTFVTVLC